MTTRLVIEEFNQQAGDDAEIDLGIPGLPPLKRMRRGNVDTGKDSAHGGNGPDAGNGPQD